MVGRVLNYFAGYKYYEIECANPYAYINYLVVNAKIFDIGYIKDNKISFKAFLIYTKRIKESNKAYNAEILCEREQGFPLLLKKSLSRKGLIVGGLLFALIIYFSSLYIWEIRVVGNEQLREEEILNTLEYLGFGEGVKKNSVNLDRLHNDYLLFEKRVSWIAVNIKGNIAFAEIKEREFPPERKNTNEYVNIVAKCDGIIQRVDALEGGKLIKEGDVVSKGQLLISAFFETKNNTVFFTDARGSVLAKTVRSFEVTVSKNNFEKVYTNNNYKNHSVKILGKTLPLHFDRKTGYDKYDKTVYESKINFFGVILPIRHIEEEYSEYRLVKKTLSEANARKKAFDELLLKMSSELKTGDISSYELSAENLEGVYILRCTVNCTEDIAKKKTVYLS